MKEGRPVERKGQEGEEGNEIKGPSEMGKHDRLKVSEFRVMTICLCCMPIQ